MQIKNTAPVLSAPGKKVGIVRARFNEKITEQLLDAAVEALKQSHVAEGDIEVVAVAGSMEIPFALQQLARSKKFDCLVAIGCVIRGETPHFDYVCKMAQEGALRVSLDHHLPVGFGVLTLNSLEQVPERIHVGKDAALAALELTLRS